MKVSPEFPQQLMWFAFELLKVLFMSFGAGFLLTIGVKQIRKAWEANNTLKIWLYLSSFCFVVYVFFIGLK